MWDILSQVCVTDSVTFWLQFVSSAYGILLILIFVLVLYSMGRGRSDSESEEERHDRFKSERNPRSAVPGGPPPGRSIPSSLEAYSTAARSNNKSLPTAPSFSRYERRRDEIERRPRYSPARRSSSRRHSLSPTPPPRSSTRERTTHRPSSSRSPPSRHRSPHSTKHKHKKSHDKHKTEKHRHKDNSSISYDLKFDVKKSRNSNEENQVNNLPIKVKDTDYKSKCDKKSKKHKRSRSESHEGRKKKKKDKKHKKKNDSLDSSQNSVIEINSSLENCDEGHKSSVDDSNSDFSENGDILRGESRNGGSMECGDKDEVNETGPVGGSDSEECLVREALPPKTVVVAEPELTSDEVIPTTTADSYGPALPPRSADTISRTYGPSLPPPSQRLPAQHSPSDAPLTPDVEERSFGPALPPSSEESPRPAPPAVLPPEEEDDADLGDVIGPLPDGQLTPAQAALQARANILKYQMENKTSADGRTEQREEWMRVLPEVRGVQLGLGPRKFRANPAPDLTGRSGWTDTPEDKARKKMLGEEDEEEGMELDTQRLAVIRRNQEMEQLAKKSSGKKSKKSLLDIHQKELKKKKKKEAKERGDKPVERIPFSRDRDLGSAQFDEAQKRSIIKKAQLLDSRFSTGESKYL